MNERKQNKKKIVLTSICIINILVLAGAIIAPTIAEKYRNGATVEIVGLEHPLTINTVSIELYGGTLEDIHESQDNLLQGKIEVYGANGFKWYEGEIERFKGCGNNSWYCPKKGYGITLTKRKIC